MTPRVQNSSYISSLRSVKSSRVENYVENSEQDESMFENSTFGLAFQIPEYDQFLQYQIKEFKTMKQNIEEESRKKAKELKSRLKEKKISDRSYNKEIKIIEIKEKAKKRQIKNNKKNFIKMLGKLHKDCEKVNKLSNNQAELEDSRIFGKSTLSLQQNESVDLTAMDRPDILESHIGKQTLTACDVSSINISIMNSAAKNTSKVSRTLHKVRENNMSIDSSRAVKAKMNKNEKHLYSIVPFDYKGKHQEVVSPSRSILVSPPAIQSPQQEALKEEIKDTPDVENTVFEQSPAPEKDGDNFLDISNNSVQILRQDEVQESEMQKEVLFQPVPEITEEELKPITPRN